MNNFLIRLRTWFRPNPDNAHFEIIGNEYGYTALCLQNGLKYDGRVLYRFDIIDENGKRWQLDSLTQCVIIHTVKPKYVKVNIWSYEGFSFSGGLIGSYRWTKI